MKRVLLLLVGILLAHSATAAAHTFDLDSKLSGHLSVMFGMSWFGIETSDPQGGGADPGWGNWSWNDSSCSSVPPNDPHKCSSFGGALEREIASKRRPLAGLYSVSGRTQESLRRIDLALSIVRRPCDDGARLDAFSVQLNSVKFTSRYPQNMQSATWDIAYRALLAYLDRAEAAGMNGAVLVGMDSTVYWHFGATYGLSTQAERVAALTDDIIDMATIAAQRPGATKVAGRPLLFFYVDAALVSVSEWTALLDDARARSGVDFYAMGSELDGSYFAAFDALVPWLNLGIWSSSTGTTVRAQAADWAKRMHAQLASSLASYPGRAIFGCLTPGFDDFTNDWGQCKPRQIPRDPQLLDGEIDYLASAPFSVRGVVVETWDDWTEGSEVEPDTGEGTAKLVQLRGGLGRLFGDPMDPVGDARLDARWRGFGQARNCCFAGGPCDGGAPMDVDLTCPGSGGHPPGDGGAPVDAGAPSDGAPVDAAQTGDAPFLADGGSRDAARRNDGAPDGGATDGASGGAGVGAGGGCGCHVADRSRLGAVECTVFALLFVGALAHRARRRRHATTR